MYIPSFHRIAFAFQGFSAEVCMSPASLETAYHLRYRAYLAAESIPPNPDELLYDEYDSAPHCRTHLIWKDDQPVATVRSCIWAAQYQWEDTEAIQYFRPEIKQFFPERPQILESNRFAVSPDFQGRQSLFAQLLLFRIHALSSASHGCDHIMTSVRPHHVKFYQKFLGMSPVSEDIQHVAWANSDVCLLTTTREDCLTTALKRGMPAILPGEVAHYARLANLPSSSNSLAA
ncbi:MAG: GNAT family N-acyltransferase [Bacteroidota bacterium]